MIIEVKSLLFEKLKQDLVRLGVVESVNDSNNCFRIKKHSRHSGGAYSEWTDYSSHMSRSIDIDLTALTLKECKQLHKMFTETNLHGCRLYAADIAKYLRASTDGIETVRARTVRQAAWMLELYVAQLLPHHMIFSKDKYGGKSYSAYYVGDVEFECEKEGDRRQGRQEAYIELKLWYIDKDCRKQSSLVLKIEDCLNLTAEDILEKRGYLPESPKLIANLKKETEAFYSIIQKIGKKYKAIGIGIADLDDDTDKDKDTYGRRKQKTVKLDHFEEASIVVDVLAETDQKDSERSERQSPDLYRWHNWNMRFHAPSEDEIVRHLEADEDVADRPETEIPVHPLVPCFDLKRHTRLRVHINNLTEYIYDKNVANHLVLPERDWQMINLLVDHSENTFKDIVANKGQSMNVLACGAPGTGKTATAEVFAEFKQRALYSVQCAQLGMTAKEVENNLSLVMRRANRWNAVLLLDEADVYISKRGRDLEQNAIVGAFLRVLEYASCILFMTTNLGNEVDDAITSRCIAKLEYYPPSWKGQIRIWKTLTKLNNLNMRDHEMEKVATKYKQLSGRDVKNLIKLASFVNSNNEPITLETIEFCLQFKPTETLGLTRNGDE